MNYIKLIMTDETKPVGVKIQSFKIVHFLPEVGSKWRGKRVVAVKEYETTDEYNNRLFTKDYDFFEVVEEDTDELLRFSHFFAIKKALLQEQQRL